MHELKSLRACSVQDVCESSIQSSVHLKTVTHTSDLCWQFLLLRLHPQLVSYPPRGIQGREDTQGTEEDTWAMRIQRKTVIQRAVDDTVTYECDTG